MAAEGTIHNTTTPSVLLLRLTVSSPVDMPRKYVWPPRIFGELAAIDVGSVK